MISMETKQIEKYLIDNPIKRLSKDPYGQTAKEFGIERERVRDVYRQLRKKGLVEPNVTETKNTVTTIFDKGSITVKAISQKEVKSPEDLADVCKVDLKKWEIIKGECSKRDVLSTTTKEGVKKYKPIYAVSATLKQRKVEDSKELQLEILKKVLGESLKNKPQYVNTKKEESGKPYLYEISIPDVHFGKLAHRDESGQDYDIKIATERYRTAISELLASVNLNSVGRILFPVGNDMVHIDSRRNETFEGTRQDSDSRFYKIVRTVKNILIETIDRLKEIAPVDVLIISGNHDPESMFMIGEMLDAYYHNDTQVDVDNSPTQRKYYQYGVNSFQYTHGNEENHKDLGLIFATEKSQLWADTSYRVVKTGHFHKRKKVDYVSVDEYQGFQVQILPSLSGADAWHKSKGFDSLKGAKGFLYHQTKGCVGEFNYNVLDVK